MEDGVDLLESNSLTGPTENMNTLKYSGFDCTEYGNINKILLTVAFTHLCS